MRHHFWSRQSHAAHAASLNHSWISMRSNKNRSKSERLPRTDASTDALHTLQQAFSNANAARPNLFGTHSILSVAQPRIAHARISHVMHGCVAIRDQNGISINEENTNRSYISNLVMTNETEPRTRRFYVDLSPEQEKVLLKKAHHIFPVESVGSQTVRVSLQSNCFNSL